MPPIAPKVEWGQSVSRQALARFRCSAGFGGLHRTSWPHNSSLGQLGQASRSGFALPGVGTLFRQLLVLCGPERDRLGHGGVGRCLIEIQIPAFTQQLYRKEMEFPSSGI